MNVSEIFFDLRRTAPSPWGDRIWVVESGELYRSRFLHSHELEDVHDGYGINSVISLLEEYPNPEWLESEIETCERLGMEFYNLKVRTPRDFDDMGKVKDLIRIYNKCETPILVHCLYGSDRCGVASFIYQRIFKEKPMEEAKEQLSLKYGHFGNFPFIRNDYKELLEEIDNEQESLKSLVRESYNGGLEANLL
jgi:protein tyrosine/serine phosphatase